MDGIDIGNLNYCVKKIEQNFTMDEFKQFIDDKATISDVCKRCGVGRDNAENIAMYCFGFEDEDGNPRNLIEEYWQNKINNAKNIDILPVVKYDDKGSTVLTVITNNGVPRYEYSYKSNEKLNKGFEVDSINLQTEKGTFALPEGVELKKMIYDKETGTYRRAFYTDEKGNRADEVYIVENGVLRNKRKGASIKLEDTVVNFYVPSKEEKASKIYAKYAPSAYFAKK